MRLAELLSPDRIAIRKPASAGGSSGGASHSDGRSKLDKPGALHELADMLGRGTSTDSAEVERVLAEREALQSTGIGEGVAIPHGALADVSTQCAALLLVPDGLDFSSIDERDVHILFAVVGPKKATGEHLRTLARVSRLLKSAEFRGKLLSQSSPSAAFDLIATEESNTLAPAPYRDSGSGSSGSHGTDGDRGGKT
jgi:PTS system nitrogen regulatory IIA component